MADVARDQHLFAPSRPAGSTRRRSASRPPASSRCRPRTRPPAAPASWSVSQAEAPGLLVVGRPVGDPVRAGRAACSRCGCSSASDIFAADRHAVVDDVEVRVAGSRRPSRRRGSLIQASRMFHSRGTVQSKTCVPLGTSWTRAGCARRCSRASGARRRPVMLRQIGIDASAIEARASRSASASIASTVMSPASSRRRSREGSGRVRRSIARPARPGDREGGIVPAKPRAARARRARDLVEDLGLVLERLEAVGEPSGT